MLKFYYAHISVHVRRLLCPFVYSLYMYVNILLRPYTPYICLHTSTAMYTLYIFSYFYSHTTILLYSLLRPYIYIYIYIHVYIFLLLYIYTCLHNSMPIYLYMSKYLNDYIPMHGYIRWRPNTLTFVHTSMPTCLYMFLTSTSVYSVYMLK